VIADAEAGASSRAAPAARARNEVTRGFEKEEELTAAGSYRRERAWRSVPEIGRLIGMSILTKSGVAAFQERGDALTEVCARGLALLERCLKCELGFKVWETGGIELGLCACI